MLPAVPQGAFCLAQKAADWDSAMIAVAFDTPGLGSAAKAKLVELVGCSSTCVFASYRPSDPDIANALVECPDTIGVFDARYGKQAIPPLSALIDTGAVVGVKRGIRAGDEASPRPHGCMHHKFAVLDESIVVTGSLQWDTGARSYENLVALRSDVVAAAFRQEVERLHSGQADPVDAGCLVRDPERRVAAALNQGCAVLLLENIEKAEQSILVAMWTVSPTHSSDENCVWNALLAALERGVSVRVVTDAAKVGKRDFSAAVAAGMVVQAMHVKGGHMHHKFVVVDGEVVLTGSANMVSKALGSVTQNLENLVAIDDPEVAVLFVSHFEEVLITCSVHV